MHLRELSELYLVEATVRCEVPSSMHASKAWWLVIIRVLRPATCTPSSLFSRI